MKKFKFGFRFLFHILIQIVICLFSFVIPKNKNSYLFGCNRGYGLRGNTKYLYLYLLSLRRNNKQEENSPSPLWITKDREVFERLMKLGIPVVYNYSLRGLYAILRAGIIFVEVSSKDFSFLGTTFNGNFDIVQTWHGTPLKHIAFDEFDEKAKPNFFKRIFYRVLGLEINNYLAVLSPSSDVSLTLNGAFRNKKAIVTGYPRNDILFDKDRYENFLREFRYHDKYKKVILYASTFRDNDEVKEFSEDFLQQLNRFLVENSFLFVVKKHPDDTQNCIDGEYSNIVDLSHSFCDVQELLIEVDVLITDYSSIFFDFCLLDKPIIYYPYDYQEYLHKCRGMYYDYFSELPGPFAMDEMDLLHKIQSVDTWFNNGDYRLKYQQFRDRFNKFQDGKSCERVLKEILNIRKK